jgi:hypothetical protein
MEQSIFDRETWLWELSIIESRSIPERASPKPTTSKKSVVIAEDEEEGESIESDTESDFSGDGLDQFIIEESLSAEEEHELNLADSEGESDRSVRSNSRNVNRPITIKEAQLSSVYVVSDDDEDEPMPDIPTDLIVGTGAILTDRTVTTRPVTSSPYTPTKHAIKQEPKFRMHSNDTAQSPNPNNANEPIILSSDTDVISLITPAKPKITPIRSKRFKLVNRNSQLNSHSDSDVQQLPDKNNLPPYESVKEIIKFNYQVWIDLRDRERLLISVLHWMDAPRTSIFSFLSKFNEQQLWSIILRVIKARLGYERMFPLQ